MRIVITPTTDIDLINGRPARRWEGVTPCGRRCDLWVCAIRAADEDAGEFDLAVLGGAIREMDEPEVRQA